MDWFMEYIIKLTWRKTNEKIYEGQYNNNLWSLVELTTNLAKKIIDSYTKPENSLFYYFEKG